MIINQTIQNVPIHQPFCFFIVPFFNQIIYPCINVPNNASTDYKESNQQDKQ